MQKLLLRLPRTHIICGRLRASTVPGSSSPLVVGGKPASEVYDEKSDKLQALDIDELPRAQKRYAIQFEKVNEKRIKEIFRRNYKNIFGLLIIAIVAGGVYWYTIYAVRQETFLEEIDEEVAIEKGEVPPPEHTPK